MFASFVEGFRRSVIVRSVSILPKRDRKLISVVVAVQVFLGFLDLIGVALVGVLGALAVSGVSSSSPGNRVMSALEFLRISNFDFQTQSAILGCSAAAVLVFRTVFSVMITRQILFFLSRRAATISTLLIRQLLTKNILFIQDRSSQTTLYALTQGVTTITVGIIGTVVTLVADLSLLMVMSIGLFLVDPLVAVSTMVVFSVVAYFLYLLMSKRAQQLGTKNSRLNIFSSEKILEVLTGYREAVVRNRRDYFAREISTSRIELANNQAEMAFLPNISKYVIEATMIVGVLGISAAQFLLQDAGRAVATLAVFVTAGTRIAPAILRIQQGSIQIRTSVGNSETTLNLIESLKGSDLLEESDDKIDFQHLGFTPEVVISGVSLTYPNSTQPALENVNFEVESGSLVAIVGRSGAGKTTLADILLGVLDQSEGRVKISGHPPLESIARWPGAIAYVPQDVVIMDGTIKENVAIGFPSSSYTDLEIWDALKLSHLDDLVMELPNGINSAVGERGTQLSGGQRQRLGIARALFTKPRLIVFDEATSSLDGATEEAISKAIAELKGTVTVIMIAHRLSTVRNADLVVYLEKGKVVSSGNFESVRANVPDFDSQAKLMGL
jgi:ABC-type multidrug transport system fused ATPase/permease subunit